MELHSSSSIQILRDDAELIALKALAISEKFRRTLSVPERLTSSSVLWEFE